MIRYNKNTSPILSYYLIIGILLLLTDSIIAQKIDFDKSFNSNLIKSCNTAIKQENNVIRTYNSKIYYTANCENSTFSNSKTTLIRLDNQGNRDSSFKTLILDSLITDIGFQSNNKILIANHFYKIDPNSGRLEPISLLRRINYDGTIDSSFTILETNNAIRVLKIMENDRILIGGNFTKVSGQNHRGIIRLMPNGDIDTTYKIGNGISASPFQHNPNSIETIAVDSHSIYLGGRFDSLNNYNVSKIVKTNYMGSIDATFKLDSKFNNNTIVYSHLLQNGNLLLAGNNNTFVKTNSFGKIDSTFKNSYLGSTNNNGLLLNVEIRKIKTQENGKILLAGWLGTTLPNQGKSGIVRLMSDGTLDSFSNINEGVQSTGYVWDISLDSLENILGAGTFSSFNGNSNIGIFKLTNRNCPKFDTTLTLTICDGYTFKNKYITNSGTYFDTLTSYNGCDSIIKLELTINGPLTGIDTIISCDSFTWINGKTYFESNDSALYKTKNIQGCDSLVRLSLKINKTTFYIDSIISCDSFKWINGNTYYSSNNNDSFVLSNSNGCDSIVKLNLILNKSTFRHDSIVACDSFTWINNITYTQSNNSDSIILKGGSDNGCDSVVYLKLTINIARVIGIMTGDTTNIIPSQPYIYAVSQQSNVFYNWVIENGIILNGLTSNIVTVQWLSPDSGSINANLIDTNNCISSVSKSLKINLSSVDFIKSQIKIFPNPSTNQFYIKNETHSQLKNITIKNIIGQNVQFNITKFNDFYEIDIANKQPGIYFIDLILSSDETVRFKVILN